MLFKGCRANGRKAPLRDGCLDSWWCAVRAPSCMPSRESPLGLCAPPEMRKSKMSSIPRHNNARSWSLGRRGGAQVCASGRGEKRSMPRRQCLQPACLRLTPRLSQCCLCSISPFLGGFSPFRFPFRPCRWTAAPLRTVYDLLAQAKWKNEKDGGRRRKYAQEQTRFLGESLRIPAGHRKSSKGDRTESKEENRKQKTRNDRVRQIHRISQHILRHIMALSSIVAPHRTRLDGGGKSSVSDRTGKRHNRPAVQVSPRKPHGLRGRVRQHEKRVRGVF